MLLRGEQISGVDGRKSLVGLQAHTTGTPSLVTWTSNSTKVAPRLIASLRDRTVFSLKPIVDDIAAPAKMFSPILQ